MRTNSLLRLVPWCPLLLAACTAPAIRDTASAPEPQPKMLDLQVQAMPTLDLLGATLGLEGLRATTPPPFSDPVNPDPGEARLRALWTNWRGIADLAPGGGFGDVYGALPQIEGTEYHALMTVPGAKQPHRVMAQVPRAYDDGARCLLVTASSGSRGIYGAIALAGGWGLPRGCAVAYTDKGAGTEFLEIDTANGPRIAFKHAHSQDNPETDWGRHVRQAAEFGLHALSLQFPERAPFRFDNTRVIAVGLSNGGGAVLRAAEIDGDWLDGVVAISPNVLPGEGGRALFDYATEAALYMPCALLDARFDRVALARPGGAKPAPSRQRCAALRAAGLLDGDTLEAQAAAALARLHDAGWSDAAIEAGALSVGFDLWRAIGAAYASAYSRSGADAMPCGYGYAAIDAQGRPRVAAPEERAAWWSDSSGIPPGAGIALLDAQAGGDDPTLPGLRCLRALWDGNGAAADALRAGVEATRAQLPRAGVPIFVLHGADDGLVPERFSGGAYAAWLQREGRARTYWRVANAQHFDAFLGLPPLAVRYVPMLPYAYRALDAMWAHVSEGTPLPADAEIAPVPRSAGADGIAPLRAENLALPAR
jgi:hydroxybutyrate-dimer hydrolase